MLSFALSFTIEYINICIDFTRLQHFYKKSSSHVVQLHVLSCFSGIQLFLTPWTLAHQAPLPMEFSRQEYWSGLLFHSPENLPNPGTKPTSPALAGRFFITSTTWKALISCKHVLLIFITFTCPCA